MSSRQHFRCIHVRRIVIGQSLRIIHSHVELSARLLAPSLDVTSSDNIVFTLATGALLDSGPETQPESASMPRSVKVLSEFAVSYNFSSLSLARKDHSYF